MSPISTSEARRLLILYCGGTFGMVHTPHGLTVSPDLEAECSQLLAEHPLADLVTEWTYQALPEVVDSAEVRPEEALQIAALVRAHAETVGAAIVIHGTDTLAYSSSVAAFALMDLAMPVVFTGAQRSLREHHSDAPNNFALAIQEALTAQHAGVRIAFGGKILPATRAMKVSTHDIKGFDAFRAVQSPGTTVLPGLDSLSRFATQHSPPRVGLLRVFPGVTANLLAAYIDEYPEGLVLETFGSGNAPLTSGGLHNIVQEATSSGTPLIAITQCLTGSVDLERYSVGGALHRAGVMSGYDMTADAALAKLLVVTALGIRGRELCEVMRTNLVGELSVP